MELTEEQRERIKRNRERALEIRQAKLKELEEELKTGRVDDKETKKRDGALKESTDSGIKSKKQKPEVVEQNDLENEVVELEAFEEGAPEYVTKQEAMKMYCLPNGTLEVCAIVEKSNPRNGSWNPMKLYKRSEIRRRARNRFGGLDGLIMERQKREDDRFKKDLEKAKDVFR